MVQRKIGYARTASSSNDINNQVEKLKAAGCDEIFTDINKPGQLSECPNLNRAMATLQVGDTFIICEVDRLARNIADIHHIRNHFKARNIKLEVIDQPDVPYQTSNNFIRRIIFKFGQFLVRQSKLGLVIRNL